MPTKDAHARDAIKTEDPHIARQVTCFEENGHKWIVVDDTSITLYKPQRDLLAELGVDVSTWKYSEKGNTYDLPFPVAMHWDQKHSGNAPHRPYKLPTDITKDLPPKPERAAEVLENLKAVIADDKPDAPNLDPKLLTIARIEESVRKNKARRAEVMAAVATILKDIDEDIETATQVANDLREEVKQESLTFVAAGGSTAHLPAPVTFNRHMKLAYDKDEVLIGAMAAHAKELIRQKPPELNVREFEKQAKAGKLPWAQFEKVNDPRVSIGALGDLVIVAEAEAPATNGKDADASDNGFPDDREPPASSAPASEGEAADSLSDVQDTLSPVRDAARPTAGVEAGTGDD